MTLIKVEKLFPFHNLVQLRCQLRQGRTPRLPLGHGNLAILCHPKRTYPAPRTACSVGK